MAAWGNEHNRSSQRAIRCVSEASKEALDGQYSTRLKKFRAGKASFGSDCMYHKRLNLKFENQRGMNGGFTRRRA